MVNLKIFISSLVFISDLTLFVLGTGSMYDPPNRAVMWKYGYNTQKDYNYMQLNCGGEKQLQQGPPKCGLCGDGYDRKREHEKGGKFGSTLVSRYFPAGIKEMSVKVELLAFEKGFFEFRLCEANNKTVTQKCLDENLLPIKEGYLSGTPMRFYPKKAGDFRLTVAIPPKMSCDRCVLQWRYHTENSWGEDTKTGESGLGVGRQEEFYNCADIRIGGEVPAAVRANPFFAPQDIRTPDNDQLVIKPSTRNNIETFAVDHRIGETRHLVRKGDVTIAGHSLSDTNIVKNIVATSDTAARTTLLLNAEPPGIYKAGISEHKQTISNVPTAATNIYHTKVASTHDVDSALGIKPFQDMIHQTSKVADFNVFNKTPRKMLVQPVAVDIPENVPLPKPRAPIRVDSATGMQQASITEFKSSRTSVSQGIGGFETRSTVGSTGIGADFGISNVIQSEPTLTPITVKKDKRTFFLIPPLNSNAKGKNIASKNAGIQRKQHLSRVKQNVHLQSGKQSTLETVLVRKPMTVESVLVSRPVTLETVPVSRPMTQPKTPSIPIRPFSNIKVERTLIDFIPPGEGYTGSNSYPDQVGVMNTIERSSMIHDQSSFNIPSELPSPLPLVPDLSMAPTSNVSPDMGSMQTLNQPSSMKSDLNIFRKFPTKDSDMTVVKTTLVGSSMISDKPSVNVSPPRTISSIFDSSFSPNIPLKDSNVPTDIGAADTAKFGSSMIYHKSQSNVVPLETSASVQILPPLSTLKSEPLPDSSSIVESDISYVPRDPTITPQSLSVDYKVTTTRGEWSPNIPPLPASPPRALSRPIGSSNTFVSGISSSSSMRSVDSNVITETVNPSSETLGIAQEIVPLNPQVPLSINRQVVVLQPEPEVRTQQTGNAEVRSVVGTETIQTGFGQGRLFPAIIDMNSAEPSSHVPIMTVDQNDASGGPISDFRIVDLTDANVPKYSLPERRHMSLGMVKSGRNSLGSTVGVDVRQQLDSFSFQTIPEAVTMVGGSRLASTGVVKVGFGQQPEDIGTRFRNMTRFAHRSQAVAGDRDGGSWRSDSGSGGQQTGSDIPAGLIPGDNFRMVIDPRTGSASAISGNIGERRSSLTRTTGGIGDRQASAAAEIPRGGDSSFAGGVSPAMRAEMESVRRFEMGGRLSGGDISGNIGERRSSLTRTTGGIGERQTSAAAEISRGRDSSFAVGMSPAMRAEMERVRRFETGGRLSGGDISGNIGERRSSSTRTTGDIGERQTSAAAEIPRGGDSSFSGGMSPAMRAEMERVRRFETGGRLSGGDILPPPGGGMTMGGRRSPEMSVDSFDSRVDRNPSVSMGSGAPSPGFRGGLFGAGGSPSVGGGGMRDRVGDASSFGMGDASFGFDGRGGMMGSMPSGMGGGASSFGTGDASIGFDGRGGVMRGTPSGRDGGASSFGMGTPFIGNGRGGVMRVLRSGSGGDASSFRMGDAAFGFDGRGGMMSGIPSGRSGSASSFRMGDTSFGADGLSRPGSLSRFSGPVPPMGGDGRPYPMRPSFGPSFGMIPPV